MWRVLSKIYPLRDRWITVCAEACLTDAGTVIAPYYTLEYPDFVHVLAFTANDRIVLTRQYRHGMRKAVLELPGGMQEESDADCLFTARRELEEETGFTAENFRLVGSFSVDPAKLTNRLHFVLAENARAGGRLNPDEHEVIEVCTRTIDELFAAIRSGEFANAAHMGMLMAALLGTEPGGKRLFEALGPTAAA